jgi:hypothetical protein
MCIFVIELPHHLKELRPISTSFTQLHLASFSYLALLYFLTILLKTILLDDGGFDHDNDVTSQNEGQTKTEATCLHH